MFCRLSLLPQLRPLLFCLFLTGLFDRSRTRPLGRGLLLSLPLGFLTFLARLRPPCFTL